MMYQELIDDSRCDLLMLYIMSGIDQRSTGDTEHAHVICQGADLDLSACRQVWFT
jgi:hypothetical protein